jgi:CheY-like chemotaxis protein/HPt (histidine-containing phosphotransfer) domain-containing protein
LYRWGLEAEESTDWKDAEARLELASEHDAPFALVFSDVNTVGNECITYLDRSRERGELDQRVIPVLSAILWGSRAHQELAKSDPAYLLKPVTPLGLSLSLRAAMGWTAEQDSALTRTRVQGVDRSPRILLAEDTPANSKLAVSLLTSRGYSVDVAPDGAQAIERWRNSRYDVILMDMEMPVLDGIQAARRMRLEESGRESTTPIIALTAHALPEDRKQILAAGIDEYVAKPIDFSELIGKIEHILSRVRAREGAEVLDPPHVDGFKLDVTLRRLNDDFQLFREMVDFFRMDTPPLLCQIESHLDQGNAAGARQSAHALLGIIVTFESEQSRRAAREVEQFAQAGDLNAAKLATARLRRELQILEQELLKESEIPRRTRSRATTSG